MERLEVTHLQNGFLWIQICPKKGVTTYHFVPRPFYGKWYPASTLESHFVDRFFFGSILMHIHFINNLATHFIGIQVCFFWAPVMHGQFIETFAWTSYKSTLVSTFRSNWILLGISSVTWFEPTRPPKSVLGQREHDIPIESTWLWPHNWFYRYWKMKNPLDFPLKKGTVGLRARFHYRSRSFNFSLR